MPYAKIIGASDGTPTPHDGRWLVAWDPHTAYGELALTSTKFKWFARRFDDLVELFEEYNTISSVEPIRPDGMPNRPLTGLTISIEQ